MSSRFPSQWNEMKGYSYNPIYHDRIFTALRSNQSRDNPLWNHYCIQLKRNLFILIITKSH